MSRSRVFVRLPFACRLKPAVPEQVILGSKGNEVVRCDYWPTRESRANYILSDVPHSRCQYRLFAPMSFAFYHSAPANAPKTSAPRFRISKTLSELTADTSDNPTSQDQSRTGTWVASDVPTIEKHWANEPKGRMSISRCRAAAASSRWCTPRNLRRTLSSMPSPRREYDR